MSSFEPTYPLELLRAELKSAMAEQLVHLMEKFVSKVDLGDFRAEFVARWPRCRSSAKGGET